MTGNTGPTNRAVRIPVKQLFGHRIIGLKQVCCPQPLFRMVQTEVFPGYSCMSVRNDGCGIDRNSQPLSKPEQTVQRKVNHKYSAIPNLEK